MMRNLLAGAILGAIFFISLLGTSTAQSQCLTEVDGTSSVTTNVTTGTSVQISVTPTGSCTSGEVTLQLSYANCSLTISDPPSPGYYSSISTGTTKTFTVTSGGAGICTITARGTTSSGSVDDNTPVILEFIDPSTLTVSGSPITVTVASGETFNLSLNISNAQSTDVLTSYALSFPAGLTRSSGDPSSSTGTTVTGGGVKVLDWTISHSTCFTNTRLITLQLADTTNAFAVNVTSASSCTSDSVSSTSSGGGGGGGGAGTASNGSVAKITFLNIAANSTKTITTGLKHNMTFVQQLLFTVSRASANAVITVERVTDLPAGPSSAPPARAVFGYVVITLSNLSDNDITSAAVDFNVTHAWLAARSVSPDAVRLYRWSGTGWTQLATTLMSVGTRENRYHADSPGLSIFGIGSEPAPAAPAPAPAPTPPSSTSPAPAPEVPAVAPLAPSPPSYPPLAGISSVNEGIVVVLILIIVAAAGAIYYVRVGRARKHE